jgi:hypothetical protein
VVLIFNRAKSPSASWPTGRIAAAFTLLAITFTAAYADTLGVGGCVGARGSINCVVRVGPAGDTYIRLVPQPETEAEKAHAAERDHRWLERCRPIVAQDRFGVPRYHYSAPGCEFGVIE